MREVVWVFCYCSNDGRDVEKEPQPLPIQLRVSAGAHTTRQMLRLWSVSTEGPMEL